MNLNKAIKELTALKPSKANKYRPYADQVLNLFKDRKIEKIKEAEKLLEQLASRGKAPQAAIKKLNEKYAKAESAIGKLDRRELKEYFVSGVIHSVHTYKQQLKKTGTVKERHYNIQTPFALPIKAKSKAETAKGKLERRELKEYFVSGITQHIITYEQKLKKKYLKNNYI